MDATIRHSEREIRVHLHSIVRKCMVGLVSGQDYRALAISRRFDGWNGAGVGAEVV